MFIMGFNSFAFVLSPFSFFLCVFSPESEVVLSHNESGRFESRFVSVGIQESPSIWLRGMEGSALGVWVAHGEGKVRTTREADDYSAGFGVGSESSGL